MLGLVRALPIVWQLGIAAVLIAGVAGGYYAWRSSIFNEGVANERAEQKERNDEAVHDGREIGNAVDACYDVGGVWNYARARCDR